MKSRSSVALVAASCLAAPASAMAGSTAAGDGSASAGLLPGRTSLVPAGAGHCSTTSDGLCLEVSDTTMTVSQNGAAVDTVNGSGTLIVDHVVFARANGRVDVTGTPTSDHLQVIVHAPDRLHIQAGGDDDEISVATDFGPTIIIDGGSGNDAIDVITGLPLSPGGTFPPSGNDALLDVTGGAGLSIGGGIGDDEIDVTAGGSVIIIGDGSGNDALHGVLPGADPEISVGGGFEFDALGGPGSDVLTIEGRPIEAALDPPAASSGDTLRTSPPSGARTVAGPQ